MSPSLRALNVTYSKPADGLWSDEMNDGGEGGGCHLSLFQLKNDKYLLVVEPFRIVKHQLKLL